MEGCIERFAVGAGELLTSLHRLSVDLDRERWVGPSALFGYVDRVVAAGVAQRCVGASQGVRGHSLFDRRDTGLLKLDVGFLDRRLEPTTHVIGGLPGPTPVRSGRRR